jgi:hypothetical protein
MKQVLKESLGDDWPGSEDEDGDGNDDLYD